MTKLSSHFSYEEMVKSDYAIRKNVDNTPNAEQLANLTHLCKHVLEPIRDAVKSFVVVTSGFRSKSVNFNIGGSDYSQHTVGRAADFEVIGMTPFVVMNKILAEQDLMEKIDQLIYEYGSWVHVGIPAKGHAPRKQALMKLHGVKGYPPYDAATIRAALETNGKA